MDECQKNIEEALRLIEARAPGFKPKLGLILGSGLGDVADAINLKAIISYSDLPGFPPSTVPGHAGKLLLGDIAGLPVVAMQGRFHLYEGHPARAVLAPIRTLYRLGCETLFVTNATGGLDPAMPAGSLMLITDHINLQPDNPLVGESGEGYGSRFPDMSQAYDPELAQFVRDAASEAKIALHEGVYAAVLGPSFETPAEVRAIRSLGADAVGMSTVPEVIVARQAGMRIVALSVVTNPGAGLSEHALSLDEVLEASKLAGRDVASIVSAVCAKLV